MSEGTCSSSPAADRRKRLTMISSEAMGRPPCGSGIYTQLSIRRRRLGRMFLTRSHRSTIICTMRSTRSYGGHISVHVPTGVIALSRVVFFSGSARKPIRMASRRSSSLRFLSYSRIRRSENLWWHFMVSRLAGKADVPHCIAVEHRRCRRRHHQARTGRMGANSGV